MKNKNAKFQDFFERMQNFFPATRQRCIDSEKKYGEIMETIIIEDIFMPELLTLLSENKNIELLKDIFNYFEEIVNEKNLYLINLLSITVFEILGNDRKILNIARQYMGVKTNMLQIQADKSLGRNIH